MTFLEINRELRSQGTPLPPENWKSRQNGTEAGIDLLDAETSGVRDH